MSGTCILLDCSPAIFQDWRHTEAISLRGVNNGLCLDCRRLQQSNRAALESPAHSAILSWNLKLENHHHIAITLSWAASHHWYYDKILRSMIRNWRNMVGISSCIRVSQGGSISTHGLYQLLSLGNSFHSPIALAPHVHNKLRWIGWKPLQLSLVFTRWLEFIMFSFCFIILNDTS